MIDDGPHPREGVRDNILQPPAFNRDQWLRLVAEIGSLNSELRDAPLIRPGERTSDFADRYRKWFMRDRRKAVDHASEVLVELIGYVPP